MIPLLFSILSIFGPRIYEVLKYTRVLKAMSRLYHSLMPKTGARNPVKPENQGLEMSNVAFKLEDSSRMRIMGSESENQIQQDDDSPKHRMQESKSKENLIWTLRNRKEAESPSILKARVDPDLRIVTEQVPPDDLER